MKNYKFLFKPLFYIFSITVASWLVLKIEKLRPSDFSKYRSLLGLEKKHSGKPHTAKPIDKNHLKQLFNDYKAGVVDSNMLDKKLEELFEN